MIKKDDIKVLLDRRQDIRNEINKLEKEYTAIGNVVEYILKRRKEEKTNDERF